MQVVGDMVRRALDTGAPDLDMGRRALGMVARPVLMGPPQAATVIMLLTAMGMALIMDMRQLLPPLHQQTVMALAQAAIQLLYETKDDESTTCLFSFSHVG